VQPNKHLLPALKDVPVDAIDEDVAQSFVTTLTKKSLSPKSVRVYFGYLRSVLGKKKTRDWEVKLPELSSEPRPSQGWVLWLTLNRCGNG
jgi:hypothetical protein